jgi:hypothetical protein
MSSWQLWLAAIRRSGHGRERAAAQCGRRRSGGNPGNPDPHHGDGDGGWVAERGMAVLHTGGVQGPPLARGRRCDSNAHAVRGMHTAGPAGARAAHAAGPGHRRRGGGGSPLVSDTNPTRTRPEDTKRARQRDNHSRAARRDTPDAQTADRNLNRAMTHHRGPPADSCIFVNLGTSCTHSNGSDPANRNDGRAAHLKREPAF